MRYGDFLWNDRNVPAGEVLVRVDLRAQTISVFRAGHEIGSAVILYGADSKPTPHGTFPILEKRAQHRSNLYDADMPYMLRLTYDGVAIHGSEVRRGAATHGCIGVPTAFARNLFEAVKRGDEVVIVS
jgi:lipoprotein-anchoring transpeptidase ErfK/SrfK